MGLYSGGLVFGRNSLLELSGGGYFQVSLYLGKGLGGGGAVYGTLVINSLNRINYGPEWKPFQY